MYHHISWLQGYWDGQETGQRSLNGEFLRAYGTYSVPLQSDPERKCGGRDALRDSRLDAGATLRSPTLPGSGAGPRRIRAAPRCDRPATAAARSPGWAAAAPESAERTARGPLPPGYPHRPR